MKHLATGFVALLAIAIVAETSLAQPPGKKGERRPEQGRQRQGGPGSEGRGRGFRPPPNPILVALDADKDGELSASEIENAAKALKTLDKNKDGKLTREELRPEGRGGPGGGDFAQRILGFDKNKDGKVSKDELPEQMRERLLERADTNKDGALDKAEIDKMAEQFRQRGGRGGEGRDGSRRPGGGERPKRPSEN